jgi:hypothetical protein
MFEVTTVAGEVFSYDTVWQHRNLVLVVVADPGDPLVSALRSHASEFHALDAACVITTNALDGMPVPGALVADRWGEILHIGERPAVDELLEWAQHSQHRCPECEGEAR